MKDDELVEKLVNIVANNEPCSWIWLGLTFEHSTGYGTGTFYKISAECFRMHVITVRPDGKVILA